MKKEAKKKLYESTVELLKESDYEDLTVGKICQNACLSRQSFYLYYHSKDEILKEIYFNLFKYTYLDKIEDKQYIESDDFIMKVIDVYEAHATIFITLEKWYYQDFLSQEKQRFLEEVSLREFNNPFIEKYFKYFMISFLTPLHYIIMGWLNGDKKESKQELQTIIKTFVYHK